MTGPRIAHIGWMSSCHLRRRVQALAHRECAAVVYTDQVPDYLDLDALPYDVVRLPADPANPPLDLLAWLDRDLAARGIDVVHSHSTHFPACLGLFCSNVVRVNSIWDFVYAKDPLSPLHHWAVLQGLESGLLAEAVSFSSPVVRREWMRRGFPAHRALLHSWGVDLDLFCPSGGLGVDALRTELGILPDERVILSSRATSLTANLDVLIKAVVRLRQEMPARLVVIGGAITREVRYLERLLAEPAARGAVVFAGAVRDDTELRKYYEMARVVASIHSNDHNPATVLEALAMSRPVVVCDIPTVTYWTREGETGFVAPHRDVQATTDALRRALALPDATWNAMGRRGRDLVSREADFSRTLDAVRADYGHLARLSKAPQCGRYALGLLCDMRGQFKESLSLYISAKQSGDAHALIDELIREKKVLQSPEPDMDYFRGRAQPCVVAMAESPESEWPELARGLPAPLSLFRHDYITGTLPLLQHDPEACLRLLATLAERFDCDSGEWLAEAVQWFGGVLGMWDACGRLLLAGDADGGTTLAIHALGCVRMLGAGHPLHASLLEKALAWSATPIAHIDPELDRLFRAGVHEEARTLLDGRRPEEPSVVERSRVYVTTDRPWTSAWGA